MDCMVVWPLLRLGVLLTLHGALHDRVRGWHVDLHPVLDTPAWHLCVSTPFFHVIATGPVMAA